MLQWNIENITKEQIGMYLKVAARGMNIAHLQTRSAVNDFIVRVIDTGEMQCSKHKYSPTQLYLLNSERWPLTSLVPTSQRPFQQWEASETRGWLLGQSNKYVNVQFCSWSRSDGSSTFSSMAVRSTFSPMAVLAWPHRADFYFFFGSHKVQCKLRIERINRIWYS